MCDAIEVDFDSGSISNPTKPGTVLQQAVIILLLAAFVPTSLCAAAAATLAGHQQAVSCWDCVVAEVRGIMSAQSALCSHSLTPSSFSYFLTNS